MSRPWTTTDPHGIPFTRALVREWPSKAVVPTDGPADPAVGIYDEFAETVATRPGVYLDPLFEDRSGVGGVERTVALPVVCLAVHRGDDPTGLYPCWNEGCHDAVEDGLAALDADARTSIPG